MNPVAVDTNILARLATGDHPGEHRAVLAALAAQPWRLFTTVILETEWVLRSVYGYTPAQFAAFVEWLEAHPQVQFADAALIRDAIGHHRAGVDFADALHIAQAQGMTFLTLDRKLLRKAAHRGMRAQSPSAARA